MASELRGFILDYMKRETAKHREHWGDRPCTMPTWWFKFNMGYETKEIRRELERMERDGLVTSDRSQSNNTKWLLKP